MSNKGRYPNLGFRNKYDIARHISGQGVPYESALALIKDVEKNPDLFWRDNIKESKPDKGKFVRNAAGTKLGILLTLIDKRVLRPYDYLIPGFIFGGLSGRNHIEAASSLLGTKRGRVYLGLDVKTFFEQITEQRIFYFFYKKAGCKIKAARLLARLCCVPVGPKGSNELRKTLGRGFATSSRLAVWANLDSFLKVKWEMGRKLRGHDPKMAIFVDDIGITAAGVSKETMETVSVVIADVLNSDANQPLPLNDKKKEIKHFEESPEHLGLKLGRNQVAMGEKSRAKRAEVKYFLNRAKTDEEKKALKNKNKSYHVYRQSISTINDKARKKQKRGGVAIKKTAI